MGSLLLLHERTEPIWKLIYNENIKLSSGFLYALECKNKNKKRKTRYKNENFIGFLEEGNMCLS